MPDILHRIGTQAPLADVHRALATRAGLAGWWTTDTTGDGEVGSKLASRFGEAGGFDMEVLEDEQAIVVPHGHPLGERDPCSDGLESG